MDEDFDGEHGDRTDNDYGFNDDGGYNCNNNDTAVTITAVNKKNKDK